MIEPIKRTHNCEVGTMPDGMIERAFDGFATENAILDGRAALLVVLM